MNPYLKLSPAVVVHTGVKMPALVELLKFILAMVPVIQVEGFFFRRHSRSFLSMTTDSFSLLKTSFSELLNN